MDIQDIRQSYQNVILTTLSLLSLNYGTQKNDLISWGNTFFFSVLLLTISTEIFIWNMRWKIIQDTIDVTDTLYFIMNMAYGQLFFGVTCVWLNFAMSHLTTVPYVIMVILFCYKCILYEDIEIYELEEVIVD